MFEKRTVPIMATGKSWKNKRKRSLYKSEGNNGFIYRDPASEDRPQTEKTITDCRDINDVRRRLEVQRFLSELKREVLASGSKTEEEIEECVDLLTEDLTHNDLYLRCLEEIPPTDEGSEMTGHIATLTANIDIYSREVGEWQELLKTKRAMVDKAKSGYSTERHINFLKLQTSDLDPLKSFLSAEDLSLIECNTDGTTGFTSTVSAQLDLIESQLDKELVRLGSLSRKKKANMLDVSMMKDSPKTLFKAIKDLRS